MTNANSLLLRTLRGLKTERTPVWMMRQAGRYLPEYRQVRDQAGSFMDLCRSPELCTKVALQPIDRFGFDAAILFSDILTIPDAMGLGLSFIEGQGPHFSNPISSMADVELLPTLFIERDLSYVLEAIRSTKSALNGRVPLLGFSGSPWTLAVYMLQGESSKDGDFPLVSAAMANNPDMVQRLLQHNTDAVSEYLLAQVDAGVDVLQIFDTWSSLLSEDDYLRLSVDSMAQIVSRVKSQTDTPIIIFTRQQNLNTLAGIGADCLSVHHDITLTQARQQAESGIVLQGNLHSRLLIQDDEQKLEWAVADVLQQAKGVGHIFNLGHGITPEAKPKMVKSMVNCVRRLSSCPSSGPS